MKALDSELPHIHRYPLTTTEHEEDTWQSLRTRIDARFPHKIHNNSVYRVDLQDIVSVRFTYVVSLSISPSYIIFIFNMLLHMVTLFRYLSIRVTNHLF